MGFGARLDNPNIRACFDHDKDEEQREGGGDNEECAMILVEQGVLIGVL
jgi:hypothetical protein